MNHRNPLECLGEQNPWDVASLGFGLSASPMIYLRPQTTPTIYLRPPTTQSNPVNTRTFNYTEAIYSARMRGEDITNGWLPTPEMRMTVDMGALQLAFGAYPHILKKGRHGLYAEKNNIVSYSLNFSAVGVRNGTLRTDIATYPAEHDKIGTHYEAVVAGKPFTVNMTGRFNLYTDKTIGILFSGMQPLTSLARFTSDVNLTIGLRYY